MTTWKKASRTERSPLTNGLGDRAVPQMTTRTEQRLVAALKKTHGTANDLAERGFMSVGRAQILLNALHATGKIHIAGWRRPPGSGGLAAIWHWGPGKDAPRPVPLTNAQRCRRYQERLRKKHGSNYNLVRETQQTRIPGRTVVVAGKKVYQQ